MSDTNKKLIPSCFIFFWVFLIIFILASIAINAHKKIRKMEREEGSAVVHAEYARLNALRQACRQQWEGKDRVPIIGGGWVDVKKIPYDFINMQENDDGECGAIGIMDGVFYWDGENIIPHHEAFSGNQHGVFGGMFTTYIPIYPEKSWVIFLIEAAFDNQKNIKECKKKGDLHAMNFQGDCMPICDSNGRASINKEFCITRPNIWPPEYPHSRIIRSHIHTDLEIILHKDSFPHFIYPEIIFRIAEWSRSEKYPMIYMHYDEKKYRKIFHATKEDLMNMDIGEAKFHFGDFSTARKEFYFYGGRAHSLPPRNISLNDAAFFSKKLYDYLSSVVTMED